MLHYLTQARYLGMIVSLIHVARDISGPVCHCLEQLVFKLPRIKQANYDMPSPSSKTPFAMDHIPNEILSHIFSYLLTEREKHRLRDDWIDHILPVRLVCHRWNDLATAISSEQSRSSRVRTRSKTTLVPGINF